MPRTSAGLLMYRFRERTLEVFLIHMGGPFWAKKDAGAWSIPKGEFGDGEVAFDAARREFTEETGFPTPEGGYRALTTVRQPGGKIVHAWAFEGDCDADALRSNTFKVQWPAGSGQWRTYPEVDKAGWFGVEAAREKILKGQVALVDELAGMVGG